MNRQTIAMACVALTIVSGCQSNVIPTSVFLDELAASGLPTSQPGKIRTRGLVVDNVVATQTLLISSFETATDVSLMVSYKNVASETQQALARLPPSPMYTSAGNIRPESLRFVEVIGSIGPQTHVLIADQIEILALPRRPVLP